MRTRHPVSNKFKSCEIKAVLYILFCRKGPQHREKEKWLACGFEARQWFLKSLIVINPHLLSPKGWYSIELQSSSRASFPTTPLAHNTNSFWRMSWGFSDGVQSCDRLHATSHLSELWISRQHRGYGGSSVTLWWALREPQTKNGPRTSYGWLPFTSSREPFFPSHPLTHNLV